jgi:iron complex outermembrane receptor protein
MRLSSLNYRKGLLRAIGAGVVTVLFFASAAVFPEDSEAPEEATELPTMSVTGSRIKRVDVEGALPVTIIDREMIELSGETSLSDFLRNLSFNSFGSYVSEGGSMFRGTSSIDLRGLGTGRSLVLVDGRRLPKSPVSALWGFQNLATIPLGSVERIEVLSDGASAIYGSDAIGGVINIVTRKDYQGWELMVGYAEPEWGEGARNEGTVMYGRAGSDSRLLVNLSWNDRDISFDRNFPGVEPAESFYGNNFITVNPDTGFPYFNFTALPGGCDGSDAFFLVPYAGSLTGEYCAYDVTRVASHETSLDTRGLLLKFEHEFATEWRLWADLSASRADSFGRFAPAAATSLWSDEPLPLDSPNNPTNPASPMYDPAFGPNVPVHWLHRFEALGFRDTTREETLLDAQAGINGWIGQAELEFGLRRSWGDTEELATGQLDPDLAVDFIAQGSYTLQDPAATPDEVMEQLRLDYPGDWSYDQDELFATLSWDLFETTAGPVQWVLGGEYRKERYRVSVDLDQGDPEYIFFGEGGADRSTTALFFETLVPLSPDLELSLAGRYDDYSDWGSEFSPKVSLRWRANDHLVLRGSWGEGFRAPPLVMSTLVPEEDILWTDSDPQSCAAIGEEPECYILYRARSIVSPALRAETSRQYSLGLVWDPAVWFSQTIDYYDIRVEDEISGIGPGQVLDLEQLGLPAPPGLGVTRDPSGLLLIVDYGQANFGLVETSGLDLNTQLSFALGPGRWRSSLQISHVFDYRFESAGERSPNVVGYVETPATRATLSNSYDVSHFSFAWNVHYVSAQDDLFWDPDAREHVPSWVTHDLQANYHAPWDGRITVGVQNVGSKQPPNANGTNFDTWLYDFYGRVYYIDYTQTFE